MRKCKTQTLFCANSLFYASLYILDLEIRDYLFYMLSGLFLNSIARVRQTNPLHLLSATSLLFIY